MPLGGAHSRALAAMREADLVGLVGPRCLLGPPGPSPQPLRERFRTPPSSRARCRARGLRVTSKKKHERECGSSLADTCGGSLADTRKWILTWICGLCVRGRLLARGRPPAQPTPCRTVPWGVYAGPAITAHSTCFGAAYIIRYIFIIYIRYIIAAMY